MGPLMAGQVAYVTRLGAWWGEASVIASSRPAPSAAAREDARRFTHPGVGGRDAAVQSAQGGFEVTRSRHLPLESVQGSCF
jgi:hypothetical protein